MSMYNTVPIAIEVFTPPVIQYSVRMVVNTIRVPHRYLNIPIDNMFALIIIWEIITVAIDAIKQQVRFFAKGFLFKAEQSSFI